jgi:hypothetical protein
MPGGTTGADLVGRLRGANDTPAIRPATGRPRRSRSGVRDQTLHLPRPARVGIGSIDRDAPAAPLVLDRWPAGPAETRRPRFRCRPACE